MNINEMVEVDAVTNAQIPVAVSDLMLTDADKLDVVGNRLYKIDEATNARIPVVSVEIRHLDSAPDYAKKETERRISANGGSWVVDRDGYVCCSIRLNVNTAGSMNIYVNGQLVTGSAVIAVHPLYQHEYSDTIKVWKDDVVTIQAGNPATVWCYFVPARYKIINPVFD